MSRHIQAPVSFTPLCRLDVRLSETRSSSGRGSKEKIQKAQTKTQTPVCSHFSELSVEHLSIKI